MAEGPEGPPDTRGADHSPRVVDHHQVGVRNAERAHLAGKLGRARQHVRKRARAVGNAVDVEERRARDMRLLELAPGIALELGHVPRPVQDAHSRANRAPARLYRAPARL